ncbi:hypothetical protein E4U54_002631 [Claviceps lovelessii]|nr:hypothetical protein E4U54_002631 [Claviceps lovelessii]
MSFGMASAALCRGQRIGWSGGYGTIGEDGRMLATWATKTESLLFSQRGLEATPAAGSCSIWRRGMLCAQNMNGGMQRMMPTEPQF